MHVRPTRPLRRYEYSARLESCYCASQASKCLSSTYSRNVLNSSPELMGCLLLILETTVLTLEIEPFAVYSGRSLLISQELSSLSKGQTLAEPLGIPLSFALRIPIHVNIGRLNSS